jgi:hypothetical protein
MTENQEKREPLVEAQKLGLITAPPTSLESGWRQLDDSIDKCLKSLKQMRGSAKFLRKYMDHPFHVEALDNIDSLIDEALIPYLAEVDREFRNVVPT